MRFKDPRWLIAFAAAILYIHSLGKVHLFDWDEINFAESAREMIESGDYLRVQINYEPFWEKPPLFFWMQVASMKIFGINEFAARLPNAMCGIFTLLVIYGIGRRMHSRRFATWWVLLHAASFLPHLYFKSGIIDPWFNLFMFLGIYFLSRFLDGEEGDLKPVPALLLSALFTGLSVLTKGPVGLGVVVSSYALSLVFTRGKGLVPIRYYLYWGLAAVAVIALWFGLEVLMHGWWFIDTFITYQIRLAGTKDAGHGGFLLYHFVVLIVGCFPASMLIFRSLKTGRDKLGRETFHRLMLASLVVILVVFTLVRTKIVHYSSFAYFPVSYLAARTMLTLLEGKVFLKGWEKAVLLAIGLVWGIAFTALPLLGNHIDLLKPLLAKDRFALANLEAEVEWGYWLVIPGILFIAAVVKSYLWLRRNCYMPAILLLSVACIGVMQVLLTSFAPRIEAYSQRAAIDFFKTLKGKDVYVDTWGYKSYGPYFYSAVQPGRRKEAKDDQWLLTGPVDKPTYLVVRINKKEKIMAEHGDKVEVLGEKNGFVFLKRRPLLDSMPGIPGTGPK
jgi:4-amino-4-deoxy-L-arabinose transferase-like glycosyltransferase